MLHFIFILSLVVACISFTITEAGIFREVRSYMKETHPKLGELFSCGYCMSHWVSFFIVAIYHPRLFVSQFTLFDYFCTAIFIVWLAAFQWRAMRIAGKIIILFESRAEFYKAQTVKETKELSAVEKKSIGFITDARPVVTPI